MKIAIITESFPPDVNGVAHCVLRVAEHLVWRGHSPMVIGTLHYDAAGDPDALDPRMWAVDRLHPSERGHRLIACRFHDQLVAAGALAGPRPDSEPSSPPPTRLAEIGWLAIKGTAWVLRRSTDLVPGLLALAIRERWAGEFPVSAATMESVAAGPDAQPVR